jgi:hypothetical protein
MDIEMLTFRASKYNHVFRVRGNNVHYCQQQFRRAFTKELDYPEKLMEAWTRFEHEYGTASSYRDARTMMRRKTKLASIQWQQVRLQRMNHRCSLLETVIKCHYQYQETEQVEQQQVAAGYTAEYESNEELTAKQVERRQKERARKLRVSEMATVLRYEDDNEGLLFASRGKSKLKKPDERNKGSRKVMMTSQNRGKKVMTSKNRLMMVKSSRQNPLSADDQAIKLATQSKRINNQKWSIMLMRTMQLKTLKRARIRRRLMRMVKLNPLPGSSLHLCCDEVVAEVEQRVARQDDWLYQTKLITLLLLARPHLPLSKAHQRKERVMMTLEPCF